MASPAAAWNRFFARNAERSQRTAPALAGEAGRLRPFANDDIYFYVKRIDNSRVVRAADPDARGACWKLMGSVVAAVVLLILVLLPSAYSLMAGYRIQSLRQEGQRLATERASLEIQEAELLSPARMEELARLQHFIDPEPRKVVYLDGQGGSLALNKK